MKTIRVRLGELSYDIVVGNGILKKLAQLLSALRLGESAYVISNKNIYQRHGCLLERSLKESGINARAKLIPDAERAKSLSQAGNILKDISKFGKQRNVFIVAFGGGVVGDLSGFVAAIYKRGIPYIQVPTTLLAQVDSAIGGKTAVDLEQGKNLAGVFYQPRLVLSDMAILESLPLRHLRSGLAEVIKYALIKDKALFHYLQDNKIPILKKKLRHLGFIVSRCSAIKAGIVSSDEKEKKGLRTILNFGHTIGHAIESAQGYRGYSHGESVALGMLVAGRISVSLGLLQEGSLRKIELLISSFGLPAKIKDVPLNRIISAHYHDKKFSGLRNKFVLLKGIGRTEIVNDVSLTLIKQAIKERLAI